MNENNTMLEEIKSHYSEKVYPIKIKLENSTAIKTGFDILLKNSSNQLIYTNVFYKATKLVENDLESKNSNIKKQLQSLGIQGNLRISSINNNASKRGMGDQAYAFRGPILSTLMINNSEEEYFCWIIIITTNKQSYTSRIQRFMRSHGGKLTKKNKNKKIAKKKITKSRKNKKA